MATLNKSLLPGPHFPKTEKFEKFFWLTAKDAIKFYHVKLSVKQKGHELLLSKLLPRLLGLPNQSQAFFQKPQKTGFPI